MRTTTFLLPILLKMISLSRRQRQRFGQLPAKYGQRLIRLGEEKLFRGCSSIVRDGVARLTPMPWNWISPTTIPSHLELKMAACCLRLNVFTKS